jgi:hypothetical protein
MKLIRINFSIAKKVAGAIKIRVVVKKEFNSSC